MKVFLSYRGGATDITRAMARALSSKGIDSVDSSGLLRTGETWSAAVEEGVKQADATVIFVEPGAETNDPRTQREWRIALDQSWSEDRRPMIPVVIGNAELPPFLRQHQAVRISGEGDIDRAAKAVASVVEGRSREPEESAVETAAQEEHNRRFREIAEEATKLAPSASDLEQQATWLGERIAAAEIDAPDSPSLANLRIERSDVLKALGRLEQALRELELAAPILAKDPTQKRRLARIEMNMARLLDRLDRRGEAKTHWILARDTYLELDGNVSVNAMVARTALIADYRALGELQAAEAEQQRLTGDVTEAASAAVGVVRALGSRALKWARSKWME